MRSRTRLASTRSSSVLSENTGTSRATSRSSRHTSEITPQARLSSRCHRPDLHPWFASTSGTPQDVICRSPARPAATRRMILQQSCNLAVTVGRREPDQNTLAWLFARAQCNNTGDGADHTVALGEEVQLARAVDGQAQVYAAGWGECRFAGQHGSLPAARVVPGGYDGKQRGVKFGAVRCIVWIIPPEGELVHLGHRS